MQGPSGGETGPPPPHRGDGGQDADPGFEPSLTAPPTATTGRDYDPRDHYPENLYEHGYYRPRRPAPDQEDDAAWGDRRHVWMRRGAIGAAVLAPIAIAAAVWIVFLSGDDEPPVATDPSSPAASAPASAQPSAIDAAPVIDPQAQQWLDVLSSETYDWEAILEAFLLYQDWLDQNPHPDLLAVAVHPNCPCYEESAGSLQAWHDRGAFWTGEQELVIHRVEAYLEPGMPYDDIVVAARETGWAGIRAVIEWKGARTLVDSDGTVHNVDTPDGPVEINVALDRRNGRWRVVSIVNLGPPIN